MPVWKSETIPAEEGLGRTLDPEDEVKSSRAGTPSDPAPPNPGPHSDRLSSVSLLDVYASLRQEDWLIGEEAKRAFLEEGGEIRSPRPRPHPPVKTREVNEAQSPQSTVPSESQKPSKREKKGARRKSTPSSSDLDSWTKHQLKRPKIYTTRYIVTFGTTFALIFIFLQSLCLNKVRHGRFHAPTSVNSMIGPDPMVLYDLGGLNTNVIREKGETFRVFWAMWMHSGWIHILLNVISQLQYLSMFEPDWGLFRTLLIYFISGVSGNLFSGTLNPCSTTVGSSGALFGLMGAMVVFCIEFWSHLPSPLCMIVFSIIIAAISLATSFTSYTDNWAHIGGIAAGLLVAFATMPSQSRARSEQLRYERREFIETLKKPPSRRKGSGLQPSTSPSETSLEGKSEDAQACFVAVGQEWEKKKTPPRRKISRWERLYWAIERKIRPQLPYWDWKVRDVVVRLFCVLVLAAMWACCFTLLLSHYDYQPLGQVTFNGVRSCCCCYGYDGLDKTWLCYPCDLAPYGEPWRDYCERTRLLPP